MLEADDLMEGKERAEIIALKQKRWSQKYFLILIKYFFFLPTKIVGRTTKIIGRTTKIVGRTTKKLLDELQNVFLPVYFNFCSYYEKKREDHFLL